MALLAKAEVPPPDYAQSIHAWQQHRQTQLRDPNGWLSLVGLFWLQPGENTIGSAKFNDIVLPKSSVAPKIGHLTLKQGEVLFTNLGGSEVTVDKKQAGSDVLLNYDELNPDVVQCGTVSFFVIKRGDRFAVRAKDSQSPTLKKFVEVKFYPVNPRFRFEAKFVRDPQKTKFPNILGQIEEDESPGYAEFTYKGKRYSLRPTVEENELFFVFQDPTSRTTTYQPGRFVKTPMPVDGKVDLDFNKAYNPPCAFTPYATCPLPPKQNVLRFPIEAGALRYGEGHGE